MIQTIEDEREYEWAQMRITDLIDAQLTTKVGRRPVLDARRGTHVQDAEGGRP